MRALSNVSFNEKKRIIELGDRAQQREFFNIAMARKFMQTFLIANGCKTLIDEGKTVSIRQMFYMTKHTLRGTRENTFEEQGESDPIIEDLEVGVDALREELHLFADKRGIVAGQLVVDDAGDRIDLSKMGRGGWSIPSICEPSVLKFVKSQAEFILLVEKAAVWSRLNEDAFWKKHKCILMTTQGQATRGARRLLQRLAGELKLPVYVLVDNDPWGLYIYSVLKQGTISLAYESMRLAVPNVRFLGMSSVRPRQVQPVVRGRDQAERQGHRAGQADEGLPVVQGQEVAEGDRRAPPQRLQDGGRRLPHQEHLVHHRGVHPEEAARPRLPRLSAVHAGGRLASRWLSRGPGRRRVVLVSRERRRAKPAGTHCDGSGRRQRGGVPGPPDLLCSR